MRTTNQLFTGDEYHLRLGVFVANSRFVSEQNRQPGSLFRCSLNHLAALTPAEYRSMLGYRKSDKVALPKKAKRAPLRRGAAPDSLDYRDQGVVNAVKDQGQCGSCWAFSAIQAIESTYALQTKNLYSLSEQNLVDCDIVSLGCEGGNMITAFAYLILLQGGKVATEVGYPYTAADGSCVYDSSKAVGPLLDDFTEGIPFDESGLKESVASYGPHAVAIDAAGVSFQLYTSGIYNDQSCSALLLDHGVGVIGYGTESGTDYWLVRNSWGVNWGEKGYIRIARNAGNECGVATEPSVPFPPGA
jgi:cathepsin L